MERNPRLTPRISLQNAGFSMYERFENCTQSPNPYKISTKSATPTAYESEG
jgi:hypothetical protein